MSNGGYAISLKNGFLKKHFFRHSAVLSGFFKKTCWVKIEAIDQTIQLALETLLHKPLLGKMTSKTFKNRGFAAPCRLLR